jgi:hypothetical protein
MWSRLLTDRAASTGDSAPTYRPSVPVELDDAVISMMPAGHRFVHEEHRPVTV